MGAVRVSTMHCKLFLSLVFFIGLAQANPTYHQYVKEFNKNYHTKEYFKREAIFKTNLKKIAEHNEKHLRGESSYTMGVNQFTDWTEEEFSSYIQGLPPMSDNVKKSDSFSESVMQKLNQKYANFEYKDSFSWVDEGIVTSVKDQGQCGSCSAFAATGSMESCFIKNTGQMIDDLSEQYLVDCANGYSVDGFDASGCQGAWPQAYFGYVKDKHSGHHLNEACYPYEAADKTCRAEDSCEYAGATITDQVYKWETNEDELQALLVEYGPVVTGLDATGLQFYNSGILDSFMCCEASQNSNCVNNNNHAVLAVGYGTHNGILGDKDYWLVKNSWGTRHGEDGFFRIKKGTGHCGFGWQLNNVGLCA